MLIRSILKEKNHTKISNINFFSGRLYLCDAYYGLYRIDLNKGGEIVPLVPANVVIDGKRNLITNV